MSLDVRHVAAPMVDQSDLPFRILCRRYGATLTYTQMILADHFLSDVAYREFHLNDLRRAASADLGRPLVVQLGGNDVHKICQVVKLLCQPSASLDSELELSGIPLCDGIDLNLGCPQRHAKEGHYGAYLLQHSDWPLIVDIVKTLVSQLVPWNIPVLVKLRLCNPAALTPQLALQLAGAGASVIVLHARHVSATRRRKGPAELGWVKEVKEALVGDGLHPKTKVISNGNVRVPKDIEANLESTDADGIMVGEALLANPSIFSSRQLGPLALGREYLELCRTYPETVTLNTIKQHLKLFFQNKNECFRTSFYAKFISHLFGCVDLAAVEQLLSREDVQAWGGT